MEVIKEDAVFEFLPTNTRNSGFLFCLEGTRRMNDNQKALLAQKGILDDQKQKKVRFDEQKFDQETQY